MRAVARLKAARNFIRYTFATFRKRRLGEAVKAIILAAGAGRRLGEVSLGRPKCLLEFDGRTLLSRHLDYLSRLGIVHTTVVTGFMRDAIHAELDRLGAGGQVDTIFNPLFESGSIVSLAAAAPVLESGEDILLMDADVLYGATLLRRLTRSSHENCFLVDMDFEPGDEPVKLCLRDGIIVEFSKTPVADIEFDRQGESVGFFRFAPAIAAALAAATRGWIARGADDAPYEDAIRELVLRDPAVFGFEDITGIPWIEIDFPADVERAEREVLGRIIRAEN